MTRLIRETIRQQPTISKRNQMDSSPSRRQSNSCRNFSNGSSRFSRERNLEQCRDCDSSLIPGCRASREGPTLPRRTISPDRAVHPEMVVAVSRKTDQSKCELASTSMGGAGLAGGEHRLLSSALPRLVGKGMKDSDNGAVSG
jgi:hypothetical protein